MRLRLPILLLLLAACESEGPVTPPLAPSYTLPARAWAGGQLVIRSDSFSAVTAVPTVRIGTVDVTVQRQGDTAFVAAVPDSMAGARTVQLTWPARSVTAGSVVIDGVVAQTTIPFTYPGISNPGTAVGVGGTARVLALSGANKEAALIDLDAGSVTLLGPRMGPTGTWEPGPTTDPNVFLFTTSTSNQLERWRILPTTQKLETFAAQLPSQLPSLAEFRPGQMLAYSGSIPNWVTYSPAQPALPPNVYLKSEGNDRIALSPRGDRLVVNGNNVVDALDGVGDGTPLTATVAAIALPGRTVAFLIPGIRSSYNQAFSANGDELAVIASAVAPATGGRLAVVDADNGAVRHVRVLGDSSVTALAYDPTRPLLYLLLTRPNAPKQLVILERTMWKEVGRVTIECQSSCAEALVVPSSQQAVFVLERVLQNGPIRSTKVSLPPQ